MCVMRNTKNTPRDSEVENNNSHAAAEANVWTKKSNSDVKKTMSNFFCTAEIIFRGSSLADQLLLCRLLF